MSSKLMDTFNATGNLIIYEEEGSYLKQLKDYCTLNDFVLSEISCSKFINSVVVYFTIVKFTPLLNKHNKIQYRQNKPQSKKDTLYSYMKHHYYPQNLEINEKISLFVDNVIDNACKEFFSHLRTE